MQQVLPAVVIAHQNGIGLRAYNREAGHKPRRIPINCDYELRGKECIMRNGQKRMRWSAWRIGVDYPFQIHDVYESTFPRVVMDDLDAWLRGI